jgi:hypothetical protein
MQYTTYFSPIYEKKPVSVAYLHKKRKQIYSMLYLGNLWQTKPTSARFQCTSSGGIGEAKSSIGGKYKGPNLFKDDSSHDK